MHQLLKPAGRLILREEHPVIGCVEVSEGSIALAEDYFDRRPEPSTGWLHFAGGESASEMKWEFTWTLGDVVTRVAQAGLRIERLAEFPSTASWRFGNDLDRIQRLPGSFLLVASKPTTGAEAPESR